MPSATVEDTSRIHTDNGEVIAEIESAPLMVTIDDPASGRYQGLPELSDRVDTVDYAPAALVDDIAYLLFTSGTTGAAKCCMLGHAEMYRVAVTMNGEMRTGCNDSALICMPMFHVGALAIILGIHARGGTVVLQKQFDPGAAVQLIASRAISVLHLAPVMVKALLDEVADPQALRSVRTVVYSAAPMTADVLGLAMSTMPRAGFLNLYGQTEAIVSGLPREMHDDRSASAGLLASVGVPFPGVRVRVTDEAGVDVPDGQAGELLVRSDMMFRGYWNDPEATNLSFHGQWYRTGDIGRLDDRGIVYLVDRKKDVIITGGENVYCPEVEDVVASLDGVAACSVVGVPDARWGEAVCAVVVPRTGAIVTLAMVAEAVRARLAGFKVPRRLIIADELPVLPSGKVDKKRLRIDAAAGDYAPGCP